LPGAQKSRLGQKGVRARRFFSRSGRRSTENGGKAEIGVLPRRERHVGGAGGAGRDPRRPPEACKGAPGTAQNRSGADSGNSGRAASLAKTPKRARRPKTKKQKPKKGRLRGNFGMVQRSPPGRRGGKEGNPPGTAGFRESGSSPLESNTPSTPVGYGELRTLTRDRRTLRVCACGWGCPGCLLFFCKIVARLSQGFCRGEAAKSEPKNTRK
jgi:hypothetical protein